ncbi:MAG: hypothetical protein D6696_14845 [Acidobacteria bacterium]|nr:MAG: hypothetical protein D6696_14845 [Acidobacteriota bacterium]
MNETPDQAREEAAAPATQPAPAGELPPLLPDSWRGARGLWRLLLLLALTAGLIRVCTAPHPSPPPAAGLSPPAPACCSPSATS